MGLDGIELVLALEEAFGVTFTNEEAASAETPGKVIDLIYSKLQTTNEKICQSQRAFYILRRVFMRQFNLPRSSIAPDTPFRGLIPRERERELWALLKEATHARSWPALARPVWMTRLFKVSALAVFGAVFFFGVRSYLGWGLSFTLGFISVGVFALFANGVTRPFRLYIPTGFKTLKDLVPHTITSDEVKWTREQVAALVKKVVLEQLGISESKYREDAHFVKDLGVG